MDDNQDRSKMSRWAGWSRWRKADQGQEITDQSGRGSAPAQAAICIIVGQKEARLLAWLVSFPGCDGMFCRWYSFLGDFPVIVRSTVCPLCKGHSWPIVRIGSDDSDQFTGQLEWKGNSSTDHCNSPNWKLDQVARRFKRGLCLSAHGSLGGYQYEHFQ